MEQSIFLINEDFFDNPFNGISQVASDIISSCRSEKLCLVFDPVALPFFEELAKIDHDLFEQYVIEFFSSFEGLSKNELPWYCLDDHCSFHINTLGELIMELDFETRGVYAFGVIPIINEFTYFLYFFISPYDTSDCYYLLSESEYRDHLQMIMDKFSSAIKGKKKKRRK